jgi:hypothetical protein
MGPPIDHGAFPVPGASGSPQRVRPRTRSVFIILNDCRQSLEELNNYSEQMTSRKYDRLDAIPAVNERRNPVDAAITIIVSLMLSVFARLCGTTHPVRHDQFERLHCLAAVSSELDSHSRHGRRAAARSYQMRLLV